MTALLAALLCVPSPAYNDHRGHNLDSLEREVGRWTPQAIDGASDGQLLALNRACRDLMLGYSQLNGDKCLFYARKALEISRRKGWVYADSDAYRYIGQQFYGREQFDSALVYYRKSMECVEQMAGGAVSQEMCEGIMTIVNGHAIAFFKGLGGLIGGFFRQKKVQKKAKSIR